MYLLDQLAEQRICESMAKGDFDHLPGCGMPLPPDDLFMVPEEMRMAYKILKNAGCIPQELELRKEISQLHESINKSVEETHRNKALKRLQCLYLRLDNSVMRETNLAIQQEYYDKILFRLTKT